MSHNTHFNADNRFSIIPHWVIFSGITSNAIHLYAVLMKYADNDTGVAFPSRARLASDLSKSVDTIDRSAKELTELGALKITRRKRKGSKENYSNLYTLITAKPGQDEVPDVVEVEAPEVAAWVRPGSRADAAVNDTHSPKPTILSTSEQSSDIQKESFTLKQSSSTKIVDKPKSNPGNLTPEARTALRKALQRVGQSIKDGHKFYSDRTQDLWWGFQEALQMIMPDEYPAMQDLIENNKWTVSAKVADPYMAGKELNTIIRTAAQNG